MPLLTQCQETDKLPGDKHGGCSHDSQRFCTKVLVRYAKEGGMGASHAENAFSRGTSQACDLHREQVQSQQPGAGVGVDEHMAGGLRL